MAYTAASYWLFLAAVYAAAAVAGPARRWIVLLAASCAFHVAVASWWSLAALGLVTSATFLSGRGLDPARAEQDRRAAFRVGVALVLGALLLLKYGAWLAGEAGMLPAAPGGGSGIPLPETLAALGVSYYALQALSYLIDVRDGVAPVERHPGRLALHLAFFPKIVQGPIERPGGLLAQLRAPVPLTGADAAAGLQLILWGLFQKVVVADRLAPLVDGVYGDLSRQAGLPILLATYLFAAQVYFDFAGYTDMALGVARLFGVRLAPNFDAPYGAASVAEFWRRWHMSFSSWLLDYVFRPLQLGLRDLRTWGTPLALVATFLVSGLWHGAAWTFVAWGLLHGLYLGADALLRRRRSRAPARTLPRWLAVVATFHLVCLAWIPFRAPSLGAALAGARRLLTDLPGSAARAASGLELDALLFLGQGRDTVLLAVAALLAGAALRPILRRAGVAGPLQASATAAPAARTPWRSPWLRTALYAVMAYLIAFVGAAAQGFMYAQY